MSDIRRYSLSEIEEMRRRGEVHVFADAPEGPAIDDDDWEEAFPGEAEDDRADREVVTLSLDREVVEALRRERPWDWQGLIEEILRDHATRSRVDPDTSRRSRGR